MDKALKKELSKTLNGYDTVDYYNKCMRDYLSNKTIFKETDQEITDEFIKHESEFLRLYKIYMSRLRFLNMVMVREDIYLKENDSDRYKEQTHQSHSIIAIIKSHINMLDTEFKFEYRVRCALEERPVPKDSMTTKALKHHVKIAKERLTGKMSPIKIMIENDIKYTPLLGYSIQLCKQNKTPWDLAKEILPSFVVLDGDQLCKREEFIYVEEDIIHEKINNVIDYVYKNNKLNFLNFRNELLGNYAEREAKKEEERQQRYLARRKTTINRHMSKAMKSHNRWYTNNYDNASLSKYPRSFGQFIDKYGALNGKLYLIIACIKHEKNYKAGYLNKSGRAKCGFILYDPYVFNSFDECQDKINELKNDGTILDGTVIRV